MSLAGKSVVVTGGAGFIGSHLVDRVAAQGPANLVVVDNLFLGKERNLEAALARFPALRFYQEDASDYSAMEAILKDEATDVMFALAVVPLPTSLERPRWTVDVNVALATVASELLRQGAFTTLIQFSSSEVYGTAQYVPMDERHPLEPLTPYAASKAAADHIVLSYHRTFGVDAAIVRPFNTFGPRQNEGAYAGIIPLVVSRALRGQPAVIYGDGNQTRDFTYVGDVVEAALRVFESPATRGQVVNAASGSEVSVNELVRRLLDALGAEVPIRYEAPRPGDVQRHAGSADQLASLTGWRPSHDLAAGLQETVQWYRSIMAESHDAR